MRIQHNIMAMNAYRNYTTNTSALSKNLEKLSSGYKINRAGDDAAGLAISEKMRAQITGLETAQKNAKDGISLVQTAEGALTEVHDMLNRMVELANQSANGTYDNDVDRANLQKELNQLRSEIDRIADSSNFNGIKLLNGTAGLNTDAFSLSSVSAQDATTVDGILGALPNAGTTAGTDTIVHKEGTDAATGTVTIDLSQLHVDAVKSAASKLTITIGTTTISLTGASNTTALDGQAIAALLVSEINKLNTSTGLLIGSADSTGLIYQAADNGNGTITLTTKFDGTGAALTNDAPNDKTDDANLAANWTIKAAAVTGGGTLTGAENVGTTNITAPKKEQAATFANTVLDFDISKVKDGMVLEIAGEKYTFAVGKDSKIDTTGAGVVNLKDLDLSDTDDQTEAMNRLTAAAAGNTTFSVGHNANGDLTLAEKTDGAGASLVTDDAILEKLSTKEGIASLLSITKPATENATVIDATASAIKEGDVLNVDGKQYVFTTDAAKAKNGQTAIVVSKFGTGTNAMTALKDQLTTDGYTVAQNGDKLTIDAKTAGGKAPTVMGGGLTLQIGDTSEHFNQLNVELSDIHVASLGLDVISIADQNSAADAVDAIKTAINTVSSVRGTLGATQNRLEHTINNLSVMTENIQDAESTIRDTDVAEEMMSYTKNNILVQSAQAMLAQANQVPQGVLQLLG